jgi:hypothetical protein
MSRVTALSLRGYARHRRRRGLPGATLNAVRTAVEYGRISRRPDGLIDVAAADRAWLENTIHDRRPPRTRRPIEADAGELVSAPVAALVELRGLLAELVGPLWRLEGQVADLQALLTAWLKLPGLLDQLEDGMRAAGVPLFAKDMPT